jgi:S1-C subfamily serine protease
MRALFAMVLASIALMSGCAALVDAPPAETPSEAAPTVTPDNTAAAGIARVTIPTLSQDSFHRRAERITMRVRNLNCGGVELGSGFATDAHTLVTNRHVVAGASLLEVDTADGRSLQVKTARVGVLGDIAFVTVDGSLPVSADLHGVARGGTGIEAVGYPLGGPFTITHGVVVDRVDGHRFGVQGPILRVTAEVRPGNSGGPLLDQRGRVAGVVYAIETATGLGLAIPMDTVNRLLDAGGLAAVPGCGGQ